MKRRFYILLGITLVGVGALADHLVAPGSSHPSAVAATTTAPQGAGSGTTATLGTAVDTVNAGTTASTEATVRAYTIASKSVVYVVSTGVGSGSGVIYDTQGDIVTNNHVISGAGSLTVTLNNGKIYPAKVIGVDRADDLAIIRIQAPGLTPARFATAGSYHIAQTVLAIGSPLGLKQSVSAGLISGLHRAAQEPNGSYIANAIQTSAPINPGNSGGAIVTLNGTVVGIPTLEQTGTSNGASAQAIGFAIPSERVVAAASQIIASGKVVHTGRPYLGIAPSDPGQSAISPFGDGSGGGQTSPTTTGAVVSQIASNGPAARAGIQQGDVITSAAGAPVTDAQDLLTILSSKKPGDTITLKVDRSGSPLTVTVHLGELPA